MQAHSPKDATQTRVGTTTANASVYAHWVCQPALLPLPEAQPAHPPVHAAHDGVEVRNDVEMGSNDAVPVGNEDVSSKESEVAKSTPKERFAGDGDPVARSASVREYIRKHEPAEDLSLEVRRRTVQPRGMLRRE